MTARPITSALALVAVLLGALAARGAATLALAANRTQQEARAPLKTSDGVDWAVRVIPLPREMRLSGGLVVTAGDVGVAARHDDSPAVATALQILTSFARGESAARCRIRLALVDEADCALPAALACRLRRAPNADQAYAIIARKVGPDAAELLLVANAPPGLLHAARTLEQLVSAPARVGDDTELLLPLGQVVDWPDLPERGEWGGNSEDDFAWLARWKFNVVEVDARARCDEQGQPIVRLDPAKIAEGARLGIKVVPMLTHLEQLTRGGLQGWEDCYGVPSPERARRSDFYPVLCMSKPRTWELIARWLKALAALPGVNDIMVWLSEEATPCFCEQCQGQDPYALEVAAVVAGFRQAQQQVNPAARLRILTSQGSYPVNDKVLAAAPPDVGITYYDGGRTYDSSHSPMIYPLLENFARSGRWLGVYPQLTNAWRTVMPWTAPQFVHARLSEFVAKRLSCVIGYVVPSNRFHEFNVMAAAEWSWNHAGRSPRDFARAYAYRAGIAAADAFADWAEKIGPAGWDVAASKLFLRLIYDPALGLTGGVPLDHRFEGGSEVIPEDRIERDLRQARQALAIARRINLPDAVDETEITIASLKLLRALYHLSDIAVQSSQIADPERAAAREALQTLDQCAAVLSSRLRRWGERVCARSGESFPSRLADTLHVAPRTASIARAILAPRLGLAENDAGFVYREVGGWSAADFATGPEQTLTFDATSAITAPGEYALCFDFVESAYGTDIRKAAVVAVEGEVRREVFLSADPRGSVSMWGRWRDMMVNIPEVVPGWRYLVEVEVRGLPADAPPDRRTCSGKVGLRRNLSAESVDPEFFIR